MDGSLPGSSFSVRVAREQDFDAVGALLAELGGGRPALPDVGPARDAVRRVFERHLARHAARQGLCLVAEREGRAIGFLSADVRERLNQATPEVWIADLIVAERARSGGVGKALLTRAVAFAAEIGAHRVSLESGHWRKDAHRFYRREGWEDVALHFSRRP